jgi:DNA polymerase-3 subunit epsilon
VAKARALVNAARARLAELQAAYTVQKSKVDGLQARLFGRLRQYHQERERLRLIVSYRRQFLDTLPRQGEEKAEGVRREYHEAKARSDREYEETAAAMAAKKELTGEEEAELAKLWKTLVKLYHPDRFAHEPDKLETYSKLTAAINRAKDNGDLDTLRQIASDPHGFILRQGWASLDFREEEHAARMRKLLESLEAEILHVLEATNQLHESPEFEFYELTARNAEMFDEVVSKQTMLLEKEISERKAEANRLFEEIEKLTSQRQPGDEIVN